MQHALFRTCKQVRAESLLIFYQYHEICFFILRPECCKFVLSWLDTIGEIGRVNIRELILELSDQLAVERIEQYMSRIHAKLSDAAKVVYLGEDTHMLPWAQGFSKRNGGKAPLFEVDHHAYDVNGTTVEELVDNTSGDVVVTFLPGKSWFGAGAEAYAVKVDGDARESKSAIEGEGLEMEREGSAG